jgi:hypothetical protein
LPKRTSEEEVKKAFKQLRRNAGQKIRRIFSNKTYLDRITDAKLILLSYVTQKSRSSIMKTTICQYIQEFESKNGKLEHLALEKLNGKKM